MATTATRDHANTLTLAEPVDADGTCTLCDPGTNTTYHVVDCADSMLGKKLAARDAGETVRVDLVPADPGGLDWIVTRMRPGAPVTAGGVR